MGKSYCDTTFSEEGLMPQALKGSDKRQCTYFSAKIAMAKHALNLNLFTMIAAMVLFSSCSDRGLFYRYERLLGEYSDGENLLWLFPVSSQTEDTIIAAIFNGKAGSYLNRQLMALNYPQFKAHHRIGGFAALDKKSYFSKGLFIFYPPMGGSAGLDLDVAAPGPIIFYEAARDDALKLTELYYFATVDTVDGRISLRVDDTRQLGMKGSAYRDTHGWTPPRFFSLKKHF